MLLKLLLLNGAVCLQLLLTCCFAQNDCGPNTINTAKEQYAIGQFNECINTLTQCMNSKGFKDFNVRFSAYKILSLCYLAIDKDHAADSLIENMLYMQPYLEPDTLNDPDRFVRAWQRVKSNLENTTIVSSVSKRPEDIRLAPATTYVITQEQIMQRGYNDLIDILKDIPGFDISIYYGQLYANVYQRGFRTNNTDKTLLLIDGVEDNDLWSNFADMSQQYPVTNIKRVEVIYGPASTMYGPNAFSGVINIITKSASDFIHKGRSIGFQVSTGYGSYNTKYIDASAGYKNNVYSLSITGRLYYSDRPNLSSQDMWDYDPSDIERSDTIYKNRLRMKDVNAEDTGAYNPVLVKQVKNQGNNKYTIIPTDSAAQLARKIDTAYYNSPAYTAFQNSAQDFFLSAKMNIAGFSLGAFLWDKNEGSGTTYMHRIASVKNTRWKPEHNAVYLNYSRNINSQMDFSVSANYELHTLNDGSKETRGIKGYYNGSLKILDLIKGITPEDSTTYYYEQSNQFRSEVRFAYTQSKFFNIVSGIELRNSLLQGYLLTSTSPNAQDSGYLPVDSSVGNNTYKETNIGIYTQGTYRTKHGLGFTAGARFDHNGIRDNLGLGYTLSPRIVIDYSVNKNWIIKAIYSAGIQNISNSTRFFNYHLVANAGLKPEKILNYELSSAYTFSKHVNTDIDFYYSAVKDVVNTVKLIDPLGKQYQQNQNIGRFKIFGIQANAYYTSKHLQVTLNYSYTNPKQTEGTGYDSTINDSTYIIADIAAHKANAIVNYSFLNHYNLNFRVNYVGNKRAGANTTAPKNPIPLFKGYCLGNASVSIKDVLKLNGLLLQFNCNNIFNKLYYSPGIRNATGLFFPDQILQMRRNYSVRINYEF